MSGHSLGDDGIGNQVSMLLIGHGFPDAAAGSVWAPNLESPVGRVEVLASACGY